MPINLRDVKEKGVKVESILNDEEEKITQVSPTVSIRKDTSSQKITGGGAAKVLAENKKYFDQVLEKKKGSTRMSPSTFDIITAKDTPLPTKLAYLKTKFDNTFKAGGTISAKTILKQGENTLDTLNNLSSKANQFVLSAIGKKNLAKQESENTRNFIKRNLTEELSENTGANKQLEMAERGGSYITRENAGGKIVSGVSQMLPRIAMNYALGIPEFIPSTKGLSGLGKVGQIAKNIGTASLINLPANVAMGTSIYGSSLEEAYNAGATESQAVKYAIGNTATEIATEWITGGVPGTNGVGGLDLLANKGINKIGNQFAKELAKYGYKMVGEGAEEALSEIINPLLKNATYSKGEKIDWGAVLESAIYGGLTSGILELPSTASNLYAINQNKKMYQQALSDNAINNALASHDLSKQESDKIKNSPFIEFGKKVKSEMKQQNNSSISKQLSDDIQIKTFENNKNNSQVEFVPINKVLNFKENGGYRTTEQIKNLMNSIKENGIVNPIELVREKDGNFRIENGNHRLEVAKQLGLEEVPVIYKNASLANSDDISYNDVGINKFVEEAYNDNELIEKISRDNEKTRNLNGNSKENSEYVEGRRPNSRDDRLPESVVRHNDGSSSDSTRTKDIKQSTNEELDNSSFSMQRNSLKEQQLKIIKKNNPAYNETSTWIRNLSDIKTFAETLQDSDWDGWQSGEFDPDYSGAMAQQALETGKIMVYSSFPIKQGVFVTPSKMEAESYSETGKTYSKIVNLNDVAWIDPTQGQYAKINSLSNKSKLQSTPLVDAFASTPKKKMADGRETFYLQDLNISDAEIDNIFNREKQSNSTPNLRDKLEIASLEQSSLRKLQKAGWNIKANMIVIDDATSNRLLKTEIMPDDIQKIGQIIETGNISKKKNEEIQLKSRIGNSEYQLDLSIDDSGIAKVSDLSKRKLTQNDLFQDMENMYEKNQKNTQPEGKMDDKITLQDNPHETKLTPKTTSEEIKQELYTGDGESKFFKNIAEKSEFLTEENRSKLSQEDIWNYKKISNDESMKTAKQKLDIGREAEISNWFSNNKKNINSVDVAEGWILLKRYQDVKDYDSMVQVAKRMREMGTQAGQAIQMYNVLSRLTPEGMVKYAQSELSEAYEFYAKGKSREWINQNHEKFDLTPNETKFIVDTMKKVEKMEDGYPKKVELAKIQSMMSNKLPPAKGAGAKAWLRISMLFNPKTQIRNVAGNAIITPVNTLADAFSAIADKQIAKKTGIRTTGTTDIKSYMTGFKEGLYQSYNDFKQDINTRNVQGNRFEIGQGKSFNERTIIGKTLNNTDKFLSFVLDAGDRPFYEATFTNSINNQLVLNNTTEVTQNMIDIATQEALSRTWQDNNNYTRLVLNARKALNTFNVKGYGLGDVLIPFAKTPANLTKAIVDYSPVGLAKTLLTEGKTFNNSLTNGQYDVKLQHKFVQDLGKGVAGSLLYVLGYALAKSKTTSGENDSDKDVSNFMKNTLGISSYSIKIGNKTFTYDWAQPIAAPFSMMADYVQNTDEKSSLHEKILSVMDTGMNLVFQQSFMASIQNVLTSYDGLTSGIINQIADLPARATPTFLKQIADMLDGTQRTTFEKGKTIETSKNKVKVKIPNVSKSLPVTRDTLGREVKKYGGENNAFNVFLNPANLNKGKTSSSAKEIYKIYQKTGDKTIMPRVAPYSITLNGKSKNLTAQERSEFQKISGEIVDANVKKLLTNQKYKKFSNEDKAEAIKGIVDYSYNKAKSEILDVDIASTFKSADKYIKNGGSLYDFYANKVYKNQSK